MPVERSEGSKIAHLLNADHLQQAVHNLINLFFIQLSRFAQRERDVPPLSENRRGRRFEIPSLLSCGWPRVVLPRSR